MFNVMYTTHICAKYTTDTQCFTSLWLSLKRLTSPLSRSMRDEDKGKFHVWLHITHDDVPSSALMFHASSSARALGLAMGRFGSG